MLTQHQRTPKEGVGRGGQTYELRALTRVEIELGKPQGREGSQEEGRVWQDALERHEHFGAMDFVHHPEEDGAGSHTKGDTVGQRIQLLAYGRGYSQNTGSESVEEVEHCSTYNHNDCPVEMTIEGSACSCTSAQQIAACDCVGQLSCKGVRHLSFRFYLFVLA